MIELMIGVALAAAPAVPSDKAAVLSVAEEMLATLHTKDSARMVSLSVPEGRVTVIVEQKEGPPSLRHYTWAQFADRISSRDPLDERLLSHAVRTDRDIAMVWGRFTVHHNGELLSCGTDHFDLIRSEGRWRVLNLTTWNRLREACGRR